MGAWHSQYTPGQSEASECGATQTGDRKPWLQPIKPLGILEPQSSLGGQLASPEATAKGTWSMELVPRAGQVTPLGPPVTLCLTRPGPRAPQALLKALPPRGTPSVPRAAEGAKLSMCVAHWLSGLQGSP